MPDVPETNTTARSHTDTSPDGALLLPSGRVARGPTAKVEAVVLVVHGGKSKSTERVRAGGVAVLRLRPVASTIANGRTRPGTAVFRLQLAVRGWNGTGQAARRDLRWALTELRRRYPDRPIVLVGHSMGGRTVLHEAAGPQVAGLVLLAPWVEDGDPVRQLTGVPVIVIQGERDRITPEPYSRPYFARAAAAGALLDRTVLPGTGHGMLQHWRTWHRLATDGVGQILAGRSV